MAAKVFRFPDGKGGTIFRIQSPTGGWIETDENGTPLSERKEDSSLPVKTPRKAATGKGRLLSVHLSEEDFSILREYIRWRCFFKEEVTRSEFVGRVLMERIRKDREFQEFRKK
jgi:hypothetical protein